MKKMNRFGALALTLCLLGASMLTACTGDPAESGDPTEGTVTTAATTVTDATDQEIDSSATLEEITTREEETTVSIEDVLTQGLQPEALQEIMQPIFKGQTTINETVMFLDRGDVKSLLYPIDEVLSVTSYDRSVTYEEGKDFVVVDGKLQVTADSAIPCITRESYYNVPESLLQTEYNGQNVLTHWGENAAMSSWQICVTYTHTARWEGFTQPCELENLKGFVQKLSKGEDVTVLFCGDSITNGANASWLANASPMQYPYPILFTMALADLYGYTVHFEYADVTAPQGGRPSRVPAEDYVAGTRGTITYVNTSIGGWTSKDGVDNREAFIENQVKAFGCDLFVVAFGMNDGGLHPKGVAKNVQKMIDCVLASDPEASFVVMATMVPNPNATNGWYGKQVEQEPELMELAEEYRAEGVPCVVCRMTSVSLSVLEHKEFMDYSGNNINHPNDFFIRVYAQTLLQTVIGYENLGAEP